MEGAYRSLGHRQSSTSLTQHHPPKTPMCNTSEEMSSSQVIFYVHILKKSKTGNIFLVLDLMYCKQIHVKTNGKQTHEIYRWNYIMQIAMFRRTTALRSAGNNKLRVLRCVLFALQEHLSKLFVLYRQYSFHNWRIVRRTHKLKKKKSILNYVIKNACLSKYRPGGK